MTTYLYSKSNRSSQFGKIVTIICSTEICNNNYLPTDLKFQKSSLVHMVNAANLFAIVPTITLATTNSPAIIYFWKIVLTTTKFTCNLIFTHKIFISFINKLISTD